MQKRFLSALRFMLLMVLLVVPAGIASAAQAIVTRQVNAPFEDALIDLEAAITDQGLKIDSRNHVADMLARTGKDLGLPPSPYKHGLVLQFCSAKLSHQAMRADPDNIAWCPYAVFIYELRDRPGKTVIGFRRLPAESAGSEAAKKALVEINALLSKIIEQAAGGF